MRLADVQPPGRIGPQDISVDSTVSTFYDNTLRIQWAWGTDARLHFVLDNLTPDSLRVIWEDARYVDERQNSHRVMHAGVKFADRGEPRLETNPFLQIQDMRDAITFVTTFSYRPVVPSINSRRIRSRYFGWP